MFKRIFVGTISETRGVKGVKPNGLMVVGRSGEEVWIRNLEVSPDDRFKLKFDSKSEELTIKIKLKDGEHVSFFDVEGSKEVEKL